MMTDQQTLEAARALAQGRTPEELAAAGLGDPGELAQLAQMNRAQIEALQQALARQNRISYQGIDISTYQGAPDFEQVRRAGIRFVIARAGYGRNSPDAQFRRNAAECNRLGLPLGAYWFSYALSPEQAVQEARYCLDAVKPYRLEYPVFFDFEYASIRYAQQQGVTVTTALATQIVTAFCEEIEKANYYAAFYTNSDLARHLFDMSALNRFDLWYAWYQPILDRTAGVWQYSSTGRVSGISGDVDLDESFRDYPVLIRNAHLNGLAPEPDTGYPAGTPPWQIEGFTSLVERGMINSPDYWKQRFNRTMTAGEIFGVMGRL